MITLIIYTLILFILGGLLWKGVYRIYERWEWKRIRKGLRRAPNEEEP